MKQFFLISLLSLTSAIGLGAQDVTTRRVATNDSTVAKSRSRKDAPREVGRPRYKAQGYRIQVFTGGNDRAAKSAAQEMKSKVQRYFPELSVYIHFQSPRWVCRVGDFVSREEAQQYVRLIRKHRLSPEAAIVKSTILRAY